jgi:hypothetical protein
MVGAASPTFFNPTLQSMTPKFKYHNILVNGRETIPGKPLYRDSTFSKKIVDFLCTRYNWAKRDKVRILDLGPLEGGHAAELVRLGFTVSCIEGREENCLKLRWLKETMGAERLHIIHDDVWNIHKYGQFDVVLCAGLLYHLDRPVEFLELISAHAKDVLILSTHYADRYDARYDVAPWLNIVKRRIYKTVPFLFRRQYFGLSAIDWNEGHRGRWLTEFKRDDNSQKLLASALTNHRSFWLTLYSLNDLVLKEFKIKDCADDHKRSIALYIATRA